MATNAVMTPKEVASFLGLGRDKTYALLASGQLPSVKLGRTYRTPRKALEEWLERRATESLSS